MAPPEKLQSDALSLEIHVRRSSRRKRTISFRMKEGVLEVSAPLRYPSSAIHTWIQTHRRWIQNRLQHTPPKTLELQSGMTLSLLGQEVTLRLCDSPKKDGRKRHFAWLESEGLETRLCLAHSSIPLKTRLKSFLKSHAETHLPLRISRLCEQSDGCLIPPDELTFGTPKTLWGRWRTKRTPLARTHHMLIHLGLLLAPLEVLDAILYHELCHRHHPNHGEAFYALLKGFVPDYERLKKELKRLNPLSLL